jgi:hypothetical protein
LQGDKILERKDQPTGVVQPAATLSVENAQVVITRAWMFGRVRYASHFTERSRERRLTTVDVGNVLRTGEIVGKPEYCPDFRNWKYRLRGTVEGETLEVVVALDPEEDYDLSPLIVLITAYFKKHYSS